MARKITGGRVIPSRKKKLTEIPRTPRRTRIGKNKPKELRVYGGANKRVLLAAGEALVMDPKTRKSKKAKIKSVVRSPANRYFKELMVKGTIIETELGTAKITNRPGQEGTVSAILIDKE